MNQNNVGSGSFYEKGVYKNEKIYYGMPITTRG